MKEIPILMSTPMVQAIIEGRKTMTRRVVKPLTPDVDIVYSHGDHETGKHYRKSGVNGVAELGFRCPYGKPGDILWVRESWNWVDGFLGSGWYIFKASEEDSDQLRWKPSIHMPKEAARIWLEVTDVRIQRVQRITHKDAIAEGASDSLVYSEMKLMTGLGDWKIPSPFSGYQFGFLSLWCQINGCDSWLANPWVWVISFKVLSATGKPNSETV